MDDRVKTLGVVAGVGAAIGVGLALGFGLRVLAVGAGLGLAAGAVLGVAGALEGRKAAPRGLIGSGEDPALH